MLQLNWICDFWRFSKFECTSQLFISCVTYSSGFFFLLLEHILKLGQEFFRFPFILGARPQEVSSVRSNFANTWLQHQLPALRTHVFQRQDLFYGRAPDVASARVSSYVSLNASTTHFNIYIFIYTLTHITFTVLFSTEQK